MPFHPLDAASRSPLKVSPAPKLGSVDVLFVGIAISPSRPVRSLMLSSSPNGFCVIGSTFGATRISSVVSPSPSKSSTSGAKMAYG